MNGLIHPDLFHRIIFKFKNSSCFKYKPKTFLFMIINHNYRILRILLTKNFQITLYLFQLNDRNLRRNTDPAWISQITITTIDIKRLIFLLIQSGPLIIYIL